MSDFNRGIMKFDGADKPIVLILSAVIILSGITFLIWWGLNTAYTA